MNYYCPYSSQYIDEIDIKGEILREKNLWDCDVLSLKFLKKDVRKYKYLDRREEEELIKQSKRNKEARNYLVLSNYLWLIQLSIKYQVTKLQLNDVISEGGLGLIKATKKIENRGYRFKSFAIFSVKANISSALNKYGSTVHYPNNAYIKFRKIHNFIERYYKIKGSEPSITEIAKSLAFTAEEINEDIEIVKKDISLDGLKTFFDDDETFENFIEPKIEEGQTLLSTYDDPISLLCRKSIKNDLESLLKQLLYDKEREIVLMYYGIGVPRMTLMEIGEKFDLASERIRQILKKAIQKLSRHTDKFREFWEYI